MDAVLPALITLGYFVLLEGLAGATVGKVVVGIRVRRPDGHRIGLGAAAIRNVARIVDAFPYVIPYLVGGIAVMRSETKQRLGDRWGTTVVILVGTETDPSALPASAMPAPAGGLPMPPPGSPAAGPTKAALPPPPP
jgi:uncharacterized RDD family membrane protein YckC